VRRRPALALALALAVAAAGTAVLIGAERAPAAVGRVLYVGDSLALGTAPQLRGALGGASVRADGRIGRPSGEAVGVLRSLFSGGYRVVVFDAGVNDDPSNPGRLAGDLAAARNVVGGRCLVVATVSRPPYNGVSVAGMNRAIRSFASSSPNVRLVDWRSFAVSNPGLINRDGVHPTGAGYAARARLFASAIRSCGSSGGGGGGGGNYGGLPPPGTPAPNGQPAPPPNGTRPRPPKRDRGGKPRAPTNPEQPAPPRPRLGSGSGVFNLQPVTFESGGARLRGDLLLPAGEGRHPAVVMIHGAGPATRAPYREQAEYLAEHGVATLIYDKRGAGESTGNPDYRYDELAGDVSAAVATLRTQREVDPDAIGLWGVSEGGWIAPMVAARDPRIAAVVAVSPPVVAPAAQEDWSVRNALEAEDAGSGAHAVTTYYRVAADVGRSGIADPVALRRTDDLGFDPAPVWRRVAQPVLAVWGAEDTIVPVRASAAALAGALASGPNRDRTFRTFAGASHALGVPAESDRPGSAPGFMALEASWLRAHLRGRAKPRVAVEPLPPASGTPVAAAEHTRLLDHWPVQLAWLLLPAVALAVLLARALLRRRRAGQGLPELREAWPPAAVVALDVTALAALAIAVAAIVSVDGRGVEAIAGVPAVLLFAWVLTLGALGGTVALVRWVRRGHPGTAVCVASGAWILLLAYWLL
jgi:dienelactone hydrolase